MAERPRARAIHAAGPATLVWAALACAPAHAGVVTVNFWDVRLGYGVLADGGSIPAPDQGLQGVALGVATPSWQQTDGVAHAGIGAESVITLAQPGGGLDFGLDLSTRAEASVGDNPDYTHERGVGEIYLDSLLLDITLSQTATVEILGASLGGLAPGLHTLGPGNYLLSTSGPLARSYVDVGANQAATDANAIHIGARVVPTPGAATALVGLPLWSRRRRRHRA